jgi:hypothetical protein
MARRPGDYRNFRILAGRTDARRRPARLSMRPTSARLQDLPISATALPVAPRCDAAIAMRDERGTLPGSELGLRLDK